MKGGIVSSSGLVTERTDMKPAIRTLVITCLTAALLCPIQALAVELNPANQALGTNLSSWQQTSLTTSRTKLGSRDAIKAHLVGYAHFSYTHPQTGFNVSSSVPVDNYFTWAAI